MRQAEKQKERKEMADTGDTAFPSRQNLPWEEKNKCRFPVWYQEVRKRPDVHTFPATVIPLSKEFQAFLKQDSVIAPRPTIWPIDACDPRVVVYGRHGDRDDAKSDDSLESLQQAEEERRQTRCPRDSNGNYNYNGNGLSDKKSDATASDEDSEEGSENQCQRGPQSFPELEKSIQQALDKLGPCFAKLDWTSCKDAFWTGGTTKIDTVGDAFMLLQSAVAVHEDIHTIETEAPEGTKCHLVLKRWEDMHPSQEFRLFIVQGKLQGISQKNYTEYYDHLQDPSTQMHLVEVVSDWFNEKIFPDQSLTNYIIDIYLDPHDRVWIVDFSNLCAETDPLLFDLHELIPPFEDLVPTFSHDGTRLRVTTGDSIRPTEHIGQSLPLDLQTMESSSQLEDFLTSLKAKGC